MNRIWAIFAIVAFLNPLCCCSAAWLWQDASQAPVHSCCRSSASGDSENAPDAPEHDPANCPHRANKSFHEGSAHEFELPTMEVAVVPYLLEVVAVGVWLNPPSAEAPRWENRQTRGPPVPCSEVYCVYLI